MTFAPRGFRKLEVVKGLAKKDMVRSLKGAKKELKMPAESAARELGFSSPAALKKVSWAVGFDDTCLNKKGS